MWWDCLYNYSCLLCRQSHHIALSEIRLNHNVRFGTLNSRQPEPCDGQTEDVITSRAASPQLKISSLPCYYLGDLVPELLPHAAVYQEVDRAGETHEGVDGQHNVVCQLIIPPIRLLLKHNHQNSIIHHNPS